MDSSVNKRIGTREEVFKGLATRTAGGLKKDDIIEKQFGSRKMYISKKLSDKMRENFNIIRSNNPNHLKRIPKRTMVAPKLNKNENAYANSTLADQNKVVSETNKKPNQQSNQHQHPNQHQQNYSNQRHQQAKTQKLSFKVKENTVRNVFYPELKGMDIKQLKEELVREESEEDLGISSSSDNNQPKKEFSIEEMPDIDMASLE
jgi:hypothetical protein